MLIVGALIAGDIFIIRNKYACLEETGGRGVWSDAIYRLTDYLEENEICRPLYMDGTLKHNIPILTRGKIEPVVLSDISKEEFSEKCEEYLSDPSNYYVLIILSQA